MKKSTLVFLIVVVGYLIFFFTYRYPFVDFDSNSERGIQFEKSTFSAALKKSTSNNKVLFVDVYATWCGPCKRLKKFVFSDEKVGDYFNQNFVSIALDAEEGEGLQIAEKYNVRSYPTLIFINTNGEVIYRHEGFVETDELLDLAKSTKEDFDEK